MRERERSESRQNWRGGRRTGLADARMRWMQVQQSGETRTGCKQAQRTRQREGDEEDGKEGIGCVLYKY